MNNVGRFLSKREKAGSSHRRDKSRDKTNDKKSRPASNDGFMSSFFKSDTPRKSLDKEALDKAAAEKETADQVALVKSRLCQFGYNNVDDKQVAFALNSKHAKGDPEKATELMVLFQEAIDGIIRPYDPLVEMKGAVNRQAVSCYLDSVLFSMFARLSAFEFILHNTFEDEPLRRLSTLVRLWVNMLRTGVLIPIDVTELLQEALKDCGWKEAALCQQQDASEAFSFITESLKLPLLTLKVDIFHTGAEDAKDDHKLIEERLLEVAVPDKNGDFEITLEECLENYFNNRIEVRRHLARSNTMSSVRSGQEVEKEEGSFQHVEVADLGSIPNTPISPTGTILPIRPTTRLRTDSIIRHRVLEDGMNESSSSSHPHAISESPRKGSTARKEVLMPAWQFFNLLPWYNNTTPVRNDAEVASHFTKTRPVLGICLKRYGWKEDCTPFRKNTFIDIPTDTRVPHFVEDDATSSNGPELGDFKLSLQSVICHRGDSVQSGHYISFIRAQKQISDGDIESDQTLDGSDAPPKYTPERWLRHDDLSNPRVSEVPDIKAALREEMPYLLFYQVLPVMEVLPPPGPLPPSYADSGVALKMNDSSPTASAQSSPPTRASYFDGTATPTIRLSSEFDRASEPRQSLSQAGESRRGSVAFTEASLASTASLSIGGSVLATSAPTTPGEETTAQRVSRAAQRFTKSGSKSRPPSSSGDNRLSATFTRTINMMKSRDNLGRAESKSDGTNTDATTSTTDLPPSARQSMDELRPIDDNKPKRTKSKIGRARDKGKVSSSDKSEQEHHHHHHHHIPKSKDADGPDRECGIM